MLEDLDQGDVAETVKIFFDASKKLAPVKKSDLSIHDVSRTLDNYNIWGIKYKLQRHQYLLDKNGADIVTKFFELHACFLADN